MYTATDWIEKPTDITSKIIELQDFSFSYLFFFPSVEEKETDAQCAMSKYDLRDRQKNWLEITWVVFIQSYGKLYSTKVARAVWREIPTNRWIHSTIWSEEAKIVA